MGGRVFGSEEVVIIAGPCAVESEEMLWEIAVRIKEAGAALLRGGAYKPRTSPYSFQGLGEQGLKVLARVGKALDMPVVTEVVDTGDVETVAAYADVLQVGARNMQNYSLLKKLGTIDKPVILKRGISATVEEWLMAAEYILLAGNEQVVLCERGIRTYEPWTRNTLDLSAVALVKHLSHLPVIADPSHATGLAHLVGPMARAAVAAGVDGLMVEVHIAPERALSDGAQSLTPDQFGHLVREVDLLAGLMGRRVR
ncbi:MAG: 3-deoxy-7-phosphoheptulonate synthase [Syntrophomonadaceae bacterium]|nr:3-deoxy-7-phosphoheptulonate synthase [Syntrophomonadaceae bacterium]